MILVFPYTVGATHNSVDLNGNPLHLNYVGTDSLKPNGGNHRSQRL